MVIHHAGSLHMRITNSSAEKLEAAFFHILAYGVGDGCAGHKVIQMIYNRFTIRHKAVQVFIERAKLFLHLNKMLGIGNSSQYF